jgi:hypothetical protein
VTDARRSRLNHPEHLDVVEVPIEPGVDQLIKLLILDCTVQ